MYLRRVYVLASKIPTASAVTCLVYACILARALAYTSHTPAARSGFSDSPERNISHSCDAADEPSLERRDPAPNCSMIPSVPHTQLDTSPTPTSIKCGAITRPADSCDTLPPVPEVWPAVPEPATSQASSRENHRDQTTQISADLAMPGVSPPTRTLTYDTLTFASLIVGGVEITPNRLCHILT